MKTFENVSSLKDATLRAGQIVETKGYYTPGDGGGGRYLIQDTATVDECVDHTLSGGTYAVLQYSEVLNVKQAGAVGDGVTDDTAAIQAALDYTDLAGIDVASLSVFIPDGSFRFDYLRLPARSCIRGASMLNTVLLRLI